MAVRGAGNVTVIYNAVDITAYLNQAELQMTVAELEATHLASTAAGSAPGLTSFTISLGGDWIKALDTAIGVDAITPVKRVVTIKFTDEAAGWVQYSWSNTGNYGYGFMSGYSISGSASGKIEHSPSIRLSGIPNRTVG